MRVLLVFAMVASTAVLPGRAAQDSSLAGLWDAAVTVNDVDIPFRMAIARDGASLRGSFFNGDERVTSSRGRIVNDAIVLEFDEYATRLEATVKNDHLEGRYDRGSRGFYAFRAKRFSPVPLEDSAAVPSIAGVWNVQVQSSKGESAWRLIVRQSGGEISAAILRVDGDTGTLTGTYKNGMFTLSHFSGARPSLFEVTPQPDGTLSIVQKGLSTTTNQATHAGQRPPTPGVQNGQLKMVAVRADDPRSTDLPQPSDPSRFTSVKDPTEPLRFSFRDLQGQVVSNTDTRFAGKVVIVAISGSWCPNCHDEAPFLGELYRTYRAQGLEIVSLTFEEAEQVSDPSRVRAFIERYQITYPVLLAGDPEELSAKLPQAVNLNSFPTTFFIGRDGLVRGAHAGFPGKASGRFHDEAKADITRRVEELLAERPNRLSRF